PCVVRAPQLLADPCGLFAASPVIESAPRQASACRGQWWGDKAVASRGGILSMSTGASENTSIPTLREAADFLSLSESGLRKWIAAGILPADSYFQSRPKGRLRFRRGRLEAWARERA